MAAVQFSGDSQGMLQRGIPDTVFLADDSAAIRQRINAMLAPCAILVVGEGATPQACIDGILATRPSVVVLDVQLEGGTGLQVLRAVRLAAPDIAFVIFSNHSGPAYRKRYLSAGAARFLDKSTDVDQLTSTIKKVLQHAHT